MFHIFNIVVLNVVIKNNALIEIIIIIIIPSALILVDYLTMVLIKQLFIGNK